MNEILSFWAQWLRPSAGSRWRVISPLRVSAPMASLTVGSDTLSSRASVVLRAAGGGPTYNQLSTRSWVLDRSLASAARRASTSPMRSSAPTIFESRLR